MAAMGWDAVRGSAPALLKAQSVLQLVSIWWHGAAQWRRVSGLLAQWPQKAARDSNHEMGGLLAQWRRAPLVSRYEEESCAGGRAACLEGSSCVPLVWEGALGCSLALSFSCGADAQRTLMVSMAGPWPRDKEGHGMGA